MSIRPIQWDRVAKISVTLKDQRTRTFLPEEGRIVEVDNGTGEVLGRSTPGADEGGFAWVFGASLPEVPGGASGSLGGADLPDPRQQSLLTWRGTHQEVP